MAKLFVYGHFVVEYNSNGFIEDVEIHGKKFVENGIAKIVTWHNQLERAVKSVGLHEYDIPHTFISEWLGTGSFKLADGNN